MRRTIWVMLLLFTCATLLPGCGAGFQALVQSMDNLGAKVEESKPVLDEAAGNAAKAIEEGKKVIEQAKDIADEMKEMEKQARIKADLNKDGKLGGLLEYGLYGSLVAAGGAEIMRRRTAKKLSDKELDERIRNGGK